MVDIKQVKQSLILKSDYYAQQIKELRDIQDGTSVTVEYRSEALKNKIEAILVDTLSDFQLLESWRLDSVGTYVWDLISPHVRYLENVRSTLMTIIQLERLDR